MRTIITLLLLSTATWVYAELPVYCIFDHAPASAFADLEVQPLAGGTVFAPFFEEVDESNEFGVDKMNSNYVAMKNRRDSYESYYNQHMSDISDLVDELSTPLTEAQIETKLDSIHTLIEEIDAEYLDAGLDIIDYMDAIDSELYGEYLDYMATGR